MIRPTKFSFASQTRHWYMESLTYIVRNAFVPLLSQSEYEPKVN